MTSFLKRAQWISLTLESEKLHMDKMAQVIRKLNSLVNLVNIFFLFIYNYWYVQMAVKAIFSQ